MVRCQISFLLLLVHQLNCTDRKPQWSVGFCSWTSTEEKGTKLCVMSCCHPLGGLYLHHAPSTQPRLSAKMYVSETFCIIFLTVLYKIYVHQHEELRSSKIWNTERKDRNMNTSHHRHDDDDDDDRYQHLYFVKELKAMWLHTYF